MTKNISNINSHSSINNMIRTAEPNKIEAYFNQNKNSKLLVLSLDDLNTEMLNQLKAKQCKMLLLNENFKIVNKTIPIELKHIQLTINDCRQSISTENIIRFEACGNYTNIYLKHLSKPVLTSRTLKHYVNLLAKSNFIRPHNKHLINLSYVANFTNGKEIELTNGIAVPVSRRRLSYIKQVLFRINKI